MSGLARRAESLGARLPPLLVAAERIAATVAQGVHGRRRVGLGDSFWQFRPFVTGDTPARIDWRQSAKSGRAAPLGWYVRETEWEAAQTVYLWRDGSPSMRWKSRLADSQKIERADLLLLALAALLLRGGERVRLLDGGQALRRPGLDSLAEALARMDGAGGLPVAANLPRHAQVVLISDFLAPLPELERGIGVLAGVPVAAHLLQVLDPAETELPYAGRIRFRGLEREADALIPRVEGVRGAYEAALTRQMEGLATLCAAAGFTCAMHRTDRPAEQALLGLFTALAP